MQVDSEAPQQEESHRQQQQLMPEAAPLVTVAHTVKIEAVHRLWSKEMSEEANVAKFGDSVQVHGHKYRVTCTFKGAHVNKLTGSVHGADLLEDVVTMAIVDVLHKKNLDQDISFFLSRPSTVENVCLFCWRNLAVLLRPHPVTCAEISVTVPGCRQTASSRAIHSTTATFSGEMGTLHVGASWPASDFNAEQLYSQSK